MNVKCFIILFLSVFIFNINAQPIHEGVLEHNEDFQCSNRPGYASVSFENFPISGGYTGYTLGGIESGRDFNYLCNSINFSDDKDFFLEKKSSVSGESILVKRFNLNDSFQENPPGGFFIVVDLVLTEDEERLYALVSRYKTYLIAFATSTLEIDLTFGNNGFIEVNDNSLAICNSWSENQEILLGYQNNSNINFQLIDEFGVLINDYSGNNLTFPWTLNPNPQEEISTYLSRSSLKKSPISGRYVVVGKKAINNSQTGFNGEFPLFIEFFDVNGTFVANRSSFDYTITPIDDEHTFITGFDFKVTQENLGTNNYSIIAVTPKTYIMYDLISGNSISYRDESFSNNSSLPGIAPQGTWFYRCCYHQNGFITFSNGLSKYISYNQIGGGFSCSG